MRAFGRAATTGVLACLLTVSCSQGDSTRVAPGSDAASPNSEAEQAFIQAMISREQIASRARTPTVNLLFLLNGTGGILDDAFRAEVVDVRPGIGIASNMDENSDTTGPRQVSFDDPQADARTFEVRVRVLETFAGDVRPGDELVLGLAFGSGLELQTVVDGVTNMGEVVTFTDRGEFVMPYDPSVTPILLDGAFLSPVRGDQVPWPAIAKGSILPQLVAKIDTLSELRTIATRVSGE